MASNNSVDAKGAKEHKGKRRSKNGNGWVHSTGFCFSLGSTISGGYAFIGPMALAYRFLVDHASLK